MMGPAERHRVPTDGGPCVRARPGRHGPRATRRPDHPGLNLMRRHVPTIPPAVEGWVEHAPSRSGSRGAPQQRPHPADGGHDSVPVYAPDARRSPLPHEGGITPDGAGAIFVVNTNGTGLRRVTPGMGLPVRTWSPDRQWIAFQKPYGSSTLVHPTEQPASGAARLTGRDGSARPRVVARRQCRLHGAERHESTIGRRTQTARRCSRWPTDRVQEPGGLAPSPRTCGGLRTRAARTPYVVVVDRPTW